MTKISLTPGEWLIVIKWTAAYFIGGNISGAIVAFLSWYYFPPSFSAWEVLVNQSIAGVVIGVGIGLPTGLVIRSKVKNVLLWTVSVIVACAFAFFVGDAITRILHVRDLYFMLTSAVLGISIGVAQWLMLKYYYRHAGWWIVANIIAHLASGILQATPFALSNLIVVGLVTGVTLVLLFRIPNISVNQEG